MNDNKISSSCQPPGSDAKRERSGGASNLSPQQPARLSPARRRSRIGSAGIGIPPPGSGFTASKGLDRLPAQPASGGGDQKQPDGAQAEDQGDPDRQAGRLRLRGSLSSQPAQEFPLRLLNGSRGQPQGDRQGQADPGADPVSQPAQGADPGGFRPGGPRRGRAGRRPGEDASEGPAAETGDQRAEQAGDEPRRQPGQRRQGLGQRAPPPGVPSIICMAREHLLPPGSVIAMGPNK
jgi:hypothetical protein